jgi:hypothetical protein
MKVASECTAKLSYQTYSLLRSIAASEFDLSSVSPTVMWQEGYFSSNLPQLIQKGISVRQPAVFERCSKALAKFGDVSISPSGILELRVHSFTALPEYPNGIQIRSYYPTDNSREAFAGWLHEQCASIWNRLMGGLHETAVVHQVYWQKPDDKRLGASPSGAHVIPYWKKWSESWSLPWKVTDRGVRMSIGLRALGGPIETVWDDEVPERLRTSENVLWLWASLIERYQKRYSDGTLSEENSEQDIFLNSIWEFLFTGRIGSFPKPMFDAANALLIGLARPKGLDVSRGISEDKQELGSNMILLRSFFRLNALSLCSEDYVL